jgi:hypothetical protein
MTIFVEPHLQGVELVVAILAFVERFIFADTNQRNFEAVE